MMQTDVFLPSWTLYKDMNSSPDDQVSIYGHFNVDAYVGGCDFSAPFTMSNDFSKIPSIPNFASLFSNELLQFPASDDQLQAMLPVEDFDMGLVGLESVLSDKVFEDSDAWSPSQSMKSNEGSMDTALTLPGEAMEIDNQLGVFHLLKAYGEAMERDQRELAEVIMRCLSEKVSPAGETLERIAFSLSPDVEKQGDYLLQESSKNYEVAFRTFYQRFPYGRFAHFAANSAIIEAMPDDVEIVHVVDFDLGEGVQWPSMIEAIARKNKMLRLTAMKREDEDFACASVSSSFEETSRRLSDYAASFGLKLKVKEMGIEDLVREIKKTKKRGGRGRRGGGRRSEEWLVFNCMVGLPHMGRVRSRKLVKEFLQVAKELLSCTGGNFTKNKGVVTLGDGDACEKLTDCSGFGSFFDGYLEHYQALLESIKYNFPVHLAEARMALETLFVKPFVSSEVWFQKWEEVRQGYHLQGVGLKESQVSREILMEAREIVNVESSFGVTLGGQSENEMVLEWRGTPLVRVSSWRN